jgi:lipid-A-disaccharide synthase
VKGESTSEAASVGRGGEPTEMKREWGRGRADRSQSSFSPGSSPSPRIMIVAGEASGDLHGADLAQRLLARDPRCELYGVAGHHMRAAGVRAIANIEDIAGLGVAELSSTLWHTLGVYRKIRAEIRTVPPSLLVLIDYAEFNLILSGVAHRAGVPVLYYILPQVWAWRRGRIRKLVERSDRMAVVFPFEAELYAAEGGRVHFVGHPLLDRIAPAQGCEQTLKRHGMPPRSRLLALLPGSRRGEIRYLLKPMVEAARTLCADHDLMPVIVLAPTLTASDLKRAVPGKDLDNIRIIRDDTYSIIAASQLALVASGTATLEAALLGCPMVIAYRMSTFTYLLGRLLVRGVDYFGMPNILAGRRLVPELVQRQVNPTSLVRAAEPMLAEPLHSEIAAALQSLRASLGLPNAADRVAAMALEMTA